MAKKTTTSAATEEKDKDKLLKDVLKEIEREYGKGAIMKLGDRAGTDVEPIPSGSLLLDQALGIGGYPKGRIIEIFGPESSGRRLLRYMRSPKCRKKADVLLLSMRKTRSIRSMRKNWESTLMN